MFSLIFKAIHRQKSKRVAAPVTTSTQLSPEQTIQLLHDWEGRSREQSELKVAAKTAAKQAKKPGKRVDTSMEKVRLFITPDTNPGVFLVSYPRVYTDKPGKSTGLWVAALEVNPEGAGSTVTVRLVKWVETEGTIKNKKVYLQFLNDLGVALNGSSQ